MKKNIVVNFPKQKRFAILKSNQKLKELIKKLAEKFTRFAEFAAKFIDVK